jgi:hypothetical protein
VEIAGMKRYTLVRGNGFVPSDFGTSCCWQGLACASTRRTHRGPILGVVAGTTIKEISISHRGQKYDGIDEFKTTKERT